MFCWTVFTGDGTTTETPSQTDKVTLQVGAPPKLDCTFWESFLVDFVTHHTMSIFILTRKKMYRLHNGMTFSAISIL